MLVLLLRTRREFVAPGDPASVRPLLQVGSALALDRSDRGASRRGNRRLLRPARRRAAARDRRAARAGAHPLAQPDRRKRPPHPRRAAPGRRARPGYGSDSLAYFALRRDKSIFLSASRRSFLAYRVVAGTAIIAGDPVGEVSERAELVEEFRRVAHAKAWRVAIAGASAQALPDYARLGFRSIYIGDEAFVRPERFSLEGRPIRKVRQSVTRLEKAGYGVEIVRPGGRLARAAGGAARGLGALARSLA